MPLVRADEYAPIVTDKGVIFYMRDTKTGKIVECFVDKDVIKNFLDEKAKKRC